MITVLQLLTDDYWNDLSCNIDHLYITVHLNMYINILITFFRHKFSLYKQQCILYTLIL